MLCECGKEFKSSARGKGKFICKSCVTNRRRFAHKLKCIEYLGGKCIRCGYNKFAEVLEFHHRNPQEKLFQISGNHCRKWEDVKTELDKCDLLCANCHREKHISKLKLSDISLNKKINCIECEKEFEIYYSSSQKFCSVECARTHTKKIFWPSVDYIVNLIKQSSFLDVAHSLGVSDNAIRKHLKKHGVDPKSVRSIKDNGK